MSFYTYIYYIFNLSYAFSDLRFCFRDTSELIQIKSKVDYKFPYRAVK